MMTASAGPSRGVGENAEEINIIEDASIEDSRDGKNTESSLHTRHALLQGRQEVRES
jgi:hypothetical protein